MKSKPMMLLTAVLVYFLTLSAGAAMAADKLVVVATEKTFEDSAAWAEFLIDGEVPLQHVTPQAFESNKKARFVVIMGSLDETGGVKSLVEECLSRIEFQRVSQVDTGEVIFKTKTWDPGQSIILITGSDWPSVEAARKEAREDWADAIGEWFDLYLSGPTT